MSGKTQRGTLTRDHELIVISRIFDLVALLPPERREFVIDYIRSRLADMPVIAQVDAAAEPEPEEPPMMPRLRGAARDAAA